MLEDSHERRVPTQFPIFLGVTEPDRREPQTGAEVSDAARDEDLAHLDRRVGPALALIEAEQRPDAVLGNIAGGDTVAAGALFDERHLDVGVQMDGAFVRSSIPAGAPVVCDELRESLPAWGRCKVCGGVTRPDIGEGGASEARGQQLLGREDRLGQSGSHWRWKELGRG